MARQRLQQMTVYTLSWIRLRQLFDTKVANSLLLEGRDEQFGLAAVGYSLVVQTSAVRNEHMRKLTQSSTPFIRVPINKNNSLLPNTHTKQCRNKETESWSPKDLPDLGHLPDLSSHIPVEQRQYFTLRERRKGGGEIIFASSYQADPIRRSKLGHFNTF